MKRAFTLIELLVVIAIIAILAAILFPVFAQAKDSAKNTTLLNGVKQMGLSAMLYGADYDDLFPLSMLSHPSQPIDLGWQDLCQPYMKNLDLTMNIKRTKISSTDPNYAWKRLQHFGMPARAATNSNATVQLNGYFSGTRAAGPVRYDGVVGFANLDQSQADWLTRVSAPSLSSSQVADPSGTMLIVEGSNWDLWMSLLNNVTDPLSRCARWQPNESHADNGKYGTAITATTKPNAGNLAGFGTTEGCSLPNGRSTVVATDTSAKSVDFRSNFYNGVNAQTATDFKVVKYLNPQGW